ncbi:MAG: tRNA uracil 4-sulfurtransferase ThiI [Clostridia bacterium]
MKEQENKISDNVIILRFGELFLKGKNRSYFENALSTDIRKKICTYGAKVKKINGRYIVCDFEESSLDKIIESIQKVFGLVSLSVATKIKTDELAIRNFCQNLVLTTNSFRVRVTRADKTFPIYSNDFEKELGGEILKNNKIKVNLFNPESDIVVDIRDDGFTYISTKKIQCAGGLPAGTAGKGLSLLSGGLDSPIATYLMAKRGLKMSCLHFHSYPHTSLQAKQKVVELKNILSETLGTTKLYMCSITEIQEEIHAKCKNEFLITIMRRFMMRIAQKICIKNKLSCIVTGESLGQVASQTVEGITCTNSVVNLIPILRPLIAYDKQNIIEIANKIKTFETSIQPFEDCCTVFLPEHPVIHPKLEDVIEEEKKLDVDGLTERSLQSIELL